MKTKTYAEYKKEQRGKQQSNSNCGSSHPMNNNNKPPFSKYASSGKKQQLIPPGSLGTLTKATYDRLKQQPQHRRMGPTTSALVRPSPLFSRPPPGAALRVMPPKKRVKLDEDDDDDKSKNDSNKNVNNNKNDMNSKKHDDSMRPKPNLFLDSPYMKGKDKLDRRESQRKQLTVPTNQGKMPPSNMMRIPDPPKSNNAIDKNKKSMSKPSSRGISRGGITQRASSLSQRSQLTQRAQLQQQRSQLQQRSPLQHRSPSLPQRSPLPQRSTMQQRSPLPQRTSLSQKNTNRNVFSLKRNNQLSQKRQHNVHGNENAEQMKQPTFLGVKFKRMKKANLADQIKRSKEGKLDLMTPDSILTSVHIKDLLNENTFATLPPAYQYQLLMLLPRCDRDMSTDGAIRLSQHALNNEFFTRSCQEFKDKLMDGEFNSDIVQRAKNEVEMSMRLDPWKVKYFEPAYGISSILNPPSEGESSKCSKDIKDEKKDDIPASLEVVESSWVAFLKFSENSTDDFEEALNKMQVAVKTAAQKGEKAKEDKDDRRKREEPIRPSDFPTRSLGQNRCTSFRSPNTLKPKSLMRGETASKEKSRKALKKAQLLQRKKAFDKQLKDAKAKIVEEARSSSRKDDDNATNLLKSKILNKSFDCNVDMKRLPNNIEHEINCSPHKMTNISSFSGGLYTTSMDSNATSMNSNCTENENSQVINLCDNMALKNLIKNSDIIKQNNDVIKQNQNNDSIKPINNFVTQVKRGPRPKRPGSRIVKGPSSFLTSSDGSCPCKLKAMAMCVQCESYWHGDCINSDQLCFLCT